MKTGKMTAVPVEFGTSESKNGKPFVFVDFCTPNGDITWRQYLTTEKGAEIAVKSLVLMGFKGEDLTHLNEPDALNTENEVSIVVESEEWEGRETFKVQWVNAKRTTQKKTLEGMSLKALFADTYKELGITPLAKKTGVTSADIPF